MEPTTTCGFLFSFSRCRPIAVPPISSKHRSETLGTGVRRQTLVDENGASTILLRQSDQTTTVSVPDAHLGR